MLKQSCTLEISFKGIGFDGNKMLLPFEIFIKGLIDKIKLKLHPSVGNTETICDLQILN